MNKAQRRALILEFEQYLKSKDIFFYRETPFSEMMETSRRFRADYSFCHPQLAKDYIVEINGGQWIRGRHNRGGVGYENDLQKSNLANINDFVYLCYTYEMLAKLEYKEDI